MQKETYHENQQNEIFKIRDVAKYALKRAHPTIKTVYYIVVPAQGFCGLSLFVANLGNRAVYYIRQPWLIETNSPPASSSGARPNGESKYRVGSELYFCFIRSIHFNLYILWVSFSFLTIPNLFFNK